MPVDTSELQAPAWLTPLAREEWERVAGELYAMGVAMPIDTVALAAYCECYIHWCLGWLIPGSLVLAFAIYWVGVIVYAIHMVTPGWLPEPKLHELRAVLFSGFVGAAVSQGIRKYL